MVLFAIMLVSAGVVWLLLSDRYRARELLVWVVFIAGVLNFLPALWTPTHLQDQTVELKAIKDVLLLALFVVCAVVNSPHISKGMAVLRSAIAAWALLFLALVVIAPSNPLGIAASAAYVYEFYAGSWHSRSRARLENYHQRAVGWNVPGYIDEFDAFLYGRRNDRTLPSDPNWQRDTVAMLKQARSDRTGWSFSGLMDSRLARVLRQGH